MRRPQVGQEADGMKDRKQYYGERRIRSPGFVEGLLGLGGIAKLQRRRELGQSHQPVRWNGDLAALKYERL